MSSMQRRSFLSLATGAVSASALGQAGIAARTPEVKVVPAGEDMEGQRRMMGFSRLTMKVAAHETNDGLFVIEQNFIRKGGPPRHMHPHQDEWFYVMEGEFVFEVGAKRFTMRAGDSALAPRGVPHVFAYVSDAPGKMLVLFTPAGKIEAFFRKVSVEGAPVSLNKALLEEYDMVFVGPPLVV